MLEWKSGFARWHEDLPIGLADARTAHGASARTKSRVPAMDQRVFTVGSFEYTQQQIESAIKSCWPGHVCEIDSHLRGRFPEWLAVSRRGSRRDTITNSAEGPVSHHTHDLRDVQAFLGHLSLHSTVIYLDHDLRPVKRNMLELIKRPRPAESEEELTA